MKKNLYLTGIVVALILSACTKKTIIEETQYEKKYEQFLPLALTALGLLLFELLIRKFYLKSLIADV